MSLSLQSDIVEVFGPVAKSARFVEIRARNGGRAALVVAGKPMQFDHIRREVACRDLRLHAQEEQGTVRFDDDAHPAFCRLREHGSQGDLSAGVEVDFRLLDVKELTRLRDLQRDQNGKRLRHAEPHIGDVNQIVRPAPIAAIDPRGVRLGCRPGLWPRLSTSGRERSNRLRVLQCD